MSVAIFKLVSSEAATRHRFVAAPGSATDTRAPPCPAFTRFDISLDEFPTVPSRCQADTWRPIFDPAWGGPASMVPFSLEDWSRRRETGIKYYSGKATYTKLVKLPALTKGRRAYLDLGEVKHIAEMTLNGQDLGVVWTAPWRVEITEAMRSGENELSIAITNVWSNRLIGDEQHPPDITWEIGDPKIRSGSFLKEFPDWFLKGEARPSKERLTFTPGITLTRSRGRNLQDYLGRCNSS